MNRLEILFLEDVPAELARVKEALRRARLDFDLHQVQTKEEFLKELQSHPPDIILSDHGLPSFDGFRALELAKNRCPEVPFIFLTGALDAELVRRGLSGGADYFVSKDHLPELLPAINKLLQQRQQQISEREELEALRSKTQSLETLVHSLQDIALILLDDERRVVAWNRGATELLGFAENEVQTRPLDFLLKEKGHPVETALDEAKRQGEAQFESWLYKKDGSELWCHVQLFPASGETGSSGYAVIIEDLTRRMLWEHTLQAREALKSAMVDTATDAIISIDAECTVKEWNAKAEEMFGIERAAAIGRDLSSLIFASTMQKYHRDGLCKFIGELQVKSPGTPLTFTAERRGGLSFPIEVSITRIQEEPAEFMVDIHDITSRRRAEKALLQSEDRYKRLIDLAPCGVIVHREGAIVLANAAAAKMLGAECPAQLNGLQIDQFVAPEFKDLVRARIAQVHEGAVAPFIEEQLVRLDGSRVDAEVAGTAISFGEGENTRAVMVIARDISDRKQAERLRAEAEQQFRERLEQQVEVRTAEWEAANKELEAFSYSVSHDLRAPLRHIDGFVELLQHSIASKIEETDKEYLRIISESAKQMGRLIDALLSFSRTGRKSLAKTKMPLNKLVEVVINDLRFDSEGRKVQWKLSDLPEVSADPSLLRQVLYNLISNSLKYTRPRDLAVIEISAETTAEEVVVAIKDNGIGFDMQYADKLFGVFQRLHSASEFEGIGIGLANVRRIIQRHGGKVWAEAAPDKGATFYFSLPREN